jgi:hypothetical protein
MLWQTSWQGSIERKIMKTSELTGAALDWAVAKCEGMTQKAPTPMTDEEAEKMIAPFYLWGTTSNRDKKGNWTTTVEKIKVVCYGINHAVGATAPSITAIGEDGVQFYGAVNMFYGSEAEAESAILYEASPYQWEDGGFAPSTDWAQGGPIIEQKRIGIEPIYQGYDVLHWSAVQELGEGRRAGPTPLIAAMRCYVASNLGDDVEVPDELHRT